MEKSLKNTKKPMGLSTKIFIADVYKRQDN